MSDEPPLLIGAVLLLIGIGWNLAAPVIYNLGGVRTGGWSWLLIIIGLVVISVRLYTMLNR